MELSWLISLKQASCSSERVGWPHRARKSATVEPSAPTFWTGWLHGRSAEVVEEELGFALEGADEGDELCQEGGEFCRGHGRVAQVGGAGEASVGFAGVVRCARRRRRTPFSYSVCPGQAAPQRE